MCHQIVVYDERNEVLFSKKKRFCCSAENGKRYKHCGNKPFKYMEHNVGARLSPW